MEQLAPVPFISRDEDAGCLGKQGYPSEGSARAGMEFFQHAGKMRTGDGIEPYKCRHCPDWHLGHSTAQAGGKVKRGRVAPP